MNNSLRSLESEAPQSEPLVRTATPSDATDIAHLVDINLSTHVTSAARWHSGSAAHRVRQLEGVVRAEARTRLHWSSFWIADSGRHIIASLACYAPSCLLRSRAVDRAAARGGYSDALRRILADTLPAVQSDAWTIDLIACRRPHGNASLLRDVFDRAIDEGRSSGFRHAYVELPEGAGEIRKIAGACGFRPTGWPHRRDRGPYYRPVDCFIRPL